MRVSSKIVGYQCQSKDAFRCPLHPPQPGYDWSCWRTIHADEPMQSPPREGSRIGDHPPLCEECGVDLRYSERGDDPAVEAELSGAPARVPSDDDDWLEWAKDKLDPHEQAGRP